MVAVMCSLLPVQATPPRMFDFVQSFPLLKEQLPKYVAELGQEMV